VGDDAPKEKDMLLRKTFAVAAAISLGAFGLTSCSSGDNATADGGKHGTIAFSPLSAKIPLLTSLGDFIKKNAAGRGYGYAMVDGDADATKQVQQITQGIDNHSYKAAWIVPVAAQAMTPVIESAQRAKVPLVLQASPEDFGLKGEQPGVVFMSPDFAAFGKAIGEAALKCIDSKAVANPEALLLKLNDTTAGSGDIAAGVNTGLDSKLKIDATSQAVDVSTAQTKVSQLLIAHPNANVIIALSNENAEGALNAYKAAGKTPACVIVGGGNDPNVETLQKSGAITTLVSWDFQAGLQAAWDALVALVNSPTENGKIISQPFRVVG